MSVKVFSTKVLIGDATFTSPTGDGTPFYMVIRATRVQRDYVHFPVILRPQVLFRPRESNPRSSALQSSALPTKLILPREKFFHPSVRLTNKSHAGLPPFDKPIKSPYFRSCIVSVLFARFHFKVIRNKKLEDCKYI